MGVNIKYSLPPHVSAEMLNQTISRIIGSPLKYTGDGDTALDSSPENYWVASPVHNYSTYTQRNTGSVEKVRDSREKLASFFDRKVEDLTKSSDGGYLSLQISMLGVNAVTILCEPSSDHFQSQGRGRAIGPNSSLFWSAIFTRLVEVFGGKMVYFDSGDYDDPKNYFKVSNADCLYQPPNKKETVEEVNCRFANALRKVEGVNQELINFLVKKKGFSNKSTDERVDALLKMGALRFEEDLNLLIPVNETPVKTNTLKF